MSSTRRTLLAAAAALGLIGPIATARAAEELRILAWQGYADDDWVAAFEAETGADVSVVFVGTDDEIWAKMQGSEGKDFDVFAVNTAQLQRYIDSGLAQPWDLAAMPNQQQTLDRFKDLGKVSGTTRDGKPYGIPFAFDAVGLLYDKTKVVPPPTSMDALWDPKYAGKVLAYDNGEHNFSFTALTLGAENPFKLSDAQLEAAKAKLVDYKKQILSYYATADEVVQIIQNNDVALVWCNYGQQQVKMLQDAGLTDWVYVNPKEGALAWLDTWALSKGAQNPELAAKWVNFLLQKKIGEELSTRTGFGNTVAPFASAGADDKIVWLEAVEDPTRRADLWNEIKAAP